jgi:predicted metal-dependent peptidase
MIVKNIHEKLLNSIQTMLIDTRVNLPYYGEFNLHVNFHEQDSIGTCAVNVTSKGMNFFYSPKFLEDMSQKEVNFIALHEDFHLLFNHPRRTITGQYDHKLSNIAQDMIINHVIWEDISHNFVEIPKDKTGKNMALFVPKEYTGKLIFEELYEWLKEKKEEYQKNKKEGGCQNSECQSCGGSGQKSDKSDSENQEKQEKSKGKSDKNEQNSDSNQDGENEPCPDCNGSGKDQSKDSSGKPSYGPYGKNPSGKNGETIDTWSTDQIFDDMENGTGEYLDKHIGDDVPEEMREAMVRDVMDRLASRGLSAGNVETTLNKLRKQRKDYLKEIKRSISNEIFGHIKQKTIVKPNRRQISGLKGNRKIKTKINVILDCSGSMGSHGDFEKVLSYVYQNDIEMNFIQADTQVNWVENFKKKRQLETMKIHGLGGTVLQPAVDYVVDNFNEFNTVLLTDGYCDNLDFSKVRGRVLLISIGTKVPISRSNGKVKQITVEKTH